MRASGATLRIEDSFFGPKPVIEARIANSSTLALSQASWAATLYINGEAQPTAKSRVHSDFRSIDGLKPNHGVTARFNVGFVKVMMRGRHWQFDKRLQRESSSN